MNRYSWVLNNPIKYRDPTGHFTEEEIMDYLGVETWDEVLAIFHEGGELEGYGGWLHILRRAELGDTVRFFHDDGILENLGDARFGEVDGRLFLFGADQVSFMVPAGVAVDWGNAYGLIIDSTVVFCVKADIHPEEFHPDLFFENIDYGGLGFDLLGIGIDLFCPPARAVGLGFGLGLVELAGALAVDDPAGGSISLLDGIGFFDFIPYAGSFIDGVSIAGNMTQAYQRAYR